MLLIDLWRTHGYAALTDDALVAQVDARQLSRPQDLEILRRAAQRACAGMFDDADELTRLIVGPCPSTTIIGFEMLGDWAHASTLYASVTPVLSGLSGPAPIDMLRMTAAAGALARAGRLCDVPALFRAVAQTHGNAARNPERFDLSVHIGSILGGLDAPELRESLDDYAEHVSRRYHQVCRRYGTNLVYLHRGAPLDVTAIIRELLGNIGNPATFSMRDLSLVEANLGMSRRDFVVDGQPQWLTIAAGLENALEEAKQRVPGQRHFFGYPLEPATAAGLDKQTAGAQLQRDALDIDAPFEIFEWRWSSRGYASLEPPYDGQLDLARRSWFSLAMLVRDAKAGARPELLPLARACAASGDAEFVQVSSEFLADACPADLREVWQARIDGCDDLDIAYLLCAALLRRGRLRDLPFVLDAYVRHSEEGEFPCLQLLFNEMLWLVPAAARFERHPELSSWSTSWLPFSSTAECRRAVENAHAELCERYGRDDLLIYRGQPLSSTHVAEQVVALTEPWQLTLYLRGRFEASTGLDCQMFFERMVPQLDAAKRIAEHFLQRVDRVSPADGTQVFFDHPVT